MNYPNILTIESAVRGAQECSALINGKWVPARSLGFCSFRYRCKATWLVFIGKADALTYEGQ